MLPVQKEIHQREWSEVLMGINGTLKIITPFKNVLKHQEKTLLSAVYIMCSKSEQSVCIKISRK